ncbi:MAG: recombinase zinc beta ribbon domain-containing protein [Rhodocyclaceae bacterium]|nr:recombinase zinc beta ribbon domain-containing protein [Rhodocyclaceae bacterium]
MAQDKKEQRVPRNVGGRPRSEAAFSGLLVCGKCGEAMYTETATGRGGVRYHYYNCRSFLKGMGCESRRLPVEKLDAHLLEEIAEKIFTADNIAGILLDIKRQSGEWACDKQLRIDGMAKELSDVDRRLRKMYESVEAGVGLNLADVAPRLRELRARSEALKIEIERLDADPGPQIVLRPDETTTAARIFRDILVSAENTSKVREFLGHVVSRIVIGDGKAMLEYLPERIVNARMSDSQCVVRWLPDLGSNQGPTD